MPNKRKYRTGLTKRELIATMAMQSILSNPTNSSVDLFGVNGNREIGYMEANKVAREAALYADALLKALEV